MLTLLPAETSTWTRGKGWDHSHRKQRRCWVCVRHGYPCVPTYQAHGRPWQVGPAYQKTRRRVSRPNRPSWRPTRLPEDLPENSPDDPIHHNLKTWRTRQDIGRFRPKQIDMIWQAMQSARLRSPGRNRLGVWEPTSSTDQYKADEATLVPIRNPQAIYTDNWM
jgi:hypothetical protein